MYLYMRAAADMPWSFVDPSLVHAVSTHLGTWLMHGAAMGAAAALAGAGFLVLRAKLRNGGANSETRRTPVASRVGTRNRRARYRAGSRIPAPSAFAEGQT
jgi:hypothetical protein